MLHNSVNVLRIVSYIAIFLKASRTTSGISIHFQCMRSKMRAAAEALDDRVQAAHEATMVM